MSADELIRSFYVAVETGDEPAIRRILAPAWEEIPPVYPGQPHGPDGYVPIVKAFNAAFPGGRFTIHEIIDATPKFTVRTTFAGPHRGEFLGRAATGRKVSFDTIDIHEVHEGRILRSWHIEDFAAFFRQVDGSASQ